MAASMLGWDNVFHCEINPFGRRVLEYWYPNSDSYEDITKTDFTKYRGQVDVLTGGFPCQPFSYAGKRNGAEDDRYLWPQMLRVINEVRPTWFVGENVNGIRTMVESGSVIEVGGEVSLFQESDNLHRYQWGGEFTIERICKNLESVGYSVQPIVVPACATGAPHRRDRVFFLAHRTTLDSHCSADLRVSGEDEGKGREERIQEWDKVRKSPVAGDVRRTPSNAMHSRCTGENKSPSSEERMWECLWRDFTGYDSPDMRRRWEGFPTQSPIYGGNDGIPFNVDSLSISFPRWRNESLKAYGNAIVPQVMYEIFRAIEQIEQPS